jgi:hypothetical protein
MCGDIAASKTVVKKACAAELDLYECRSCGRVSSGKLYVEDIEVAADVGSLPYARQVFNRLTAEHAQQLLEQAKVALIKEGRAMEEMRLESAQNAFDF